MTESKTLSVASVQMVCIFGEREENFKKAESFIDQAIEKGAELALLPEFFPSGYSLNEELWEYAETFEGVSFKWATELSARLEIYLGFTFLETDGEDFYNTFVLFSPAGKLLGRVRKNPPASAEAYLFKAGNDSHVIETEIGKIGVGICYENILYKNLAKLYEENVDMVLSPSAIAWPTRIIPGDLRKYMRAVLECRWRTPYTLGAPVVLANRVGPLKCKLPGKMGDFSSHFVGLSSITDFNGKQLASLQDEERVIVGEVSVGRNNEYSVKPEKFGRYWSIPVPWYMPLWMLIQKLGERNYSRNPRRKEQARRLFESHEASRFDESVDYCVNS